MTARSGTALVGVLAVLAVGVVLLRAATMTRHTPVDPGLALAAVVRADVVREPPGAVAPLTRALVDVCRLEVGAARGAVERVGRAEFRIVLRPALDESDRRRLHGCLEDARVEHLQLDVLTMRTVDEGTRAQTQPLRYGGSR